MKSPLLVGLSFASLTLAAVLGCAAGNPPLARQAEPATSGKPIASATPALAPLSPARPPPPVVTTPMAGEPDAKALAEVRLVQTSCEADDGATKRRAELLIRQMQAEIDGEYQSWQEEQPACWQYYRERARPRLPSRYGSAWGAGGIGLSGIGEGGGGHGYGVGLGDGGVASGQISSKSKAAKAGSASGTNNQVAGVDEADIVKNDGRYVYLAMNGALRIVEAMNPRTLSVTKLDGNVRELFVNGDRAVVYLSHGGNGRQRCTYGYDCQFASDGSSTSIVVLDVSERTAPKLERRFELSGSLLTARRVGNAVHTVLADGDPERPQYATWPGDLNRCGVREKTVIAKLKQLKADNERRIRASLRSSVPTLSEGGKKRALCDGMLSTPIQDGDAFTTVLSFDMTQKAQAPTTATLQSRPGAVFASADALYLSVVHGKANAGGRWYSFYPTSDEVSDIHKFRIGEDPAATRYLGSGVVPGHVLNQFAMDEWYGYLRVATSRGRVPDPKVESVVSILASAADGSLVRVGAVDKLAPGEDIRAVRFDGDRGYVVTFKKTDPLFVIDLYQPQSPKVLGELKIPGFSTYMHRIDADHLLSIGFDADDKGDFAYFDGVILQLFDVSKPTAPRLIHKEKIGTRGSSSEAATNHLAFNYFGEKGLLAFPMTICEGGGDGRHGDNLTFGGLLVYTVSVERGFERLGGIDHGTKGASCSTWWSQATSTVKRSIFLDDLVYSIASDRLKVQKLGKFGSDVASIELTP
jgi:hypothetical protein